MSLSLELEPQEMVTLATCIKFTRDQLGAVSLPKGPKANAAARRELMLMDGLYEKLHVLGVTLSPDEIDSIERLPSMRT